MNGDSFPLLTALINQNLVASQNIACEGPPGQPKTVG